MDEVYKKKHIYAEGWTSHELDIFAKRARVAAMISTVISIVLIITPLWLTSGYSQTITTTVVVYAGLSILLCGLVIYWSRSFHQENLKDDTLGTVETIEYNKNYSTVVLILAFFMIISSGCLAMIVAFWKQVGADAFLAEYGSENSFLSYYGLMMNIVIPLLIVNGFLQCMFAFASYITLEEKHYLQTLIYIFTIMFTLCTIMTLYFLKTSQFLQSQPTVPHYADINLSTFCKMQCYFAVLVLSIVVFVTNYLRRTEFYFFAGSLVLISVFCFALTQYLYFKEANTVKLSYVAQCSQQMRISNADWLKDSCLCEKYTKQDGQYTQQCSMQWLAQVWDITTTTQMACLNPNCCTTMANEYSKSYFGAAFSLMGTVVFGFALTICLFQISTKSTNEAPRGRLLDYVFLLLLIAVFVTGAVLLFPPVSLKLPQQQQVVLADEQGTITIEANKNPIVYPANWQGVTGCQPLSKVYGRQFAFTKCTPATQSCTASDDAVRASFLSQGAALLVTEYLNTPQLMYIQQQLGQQLIFPGSQPTDGFLSVQGEMSEVSNFLNTKVQLCQQTITTPPSDQQLKVDIFYLPYPTPNKHNRVLFTAPKIHTDIPTSATGGGDFDFTAAQNTYLDSMVFANLTIVVSPNRAAEVIFFRSSAECGIQSSIPNRFLMTDSHGKLTIYNMAAKQYFIGIRADGYYLYCNSFTLPGVKSVKEYNMNVALIKKEDTIGQFTVVLQRQIVPVPANNQPTPPQFEMALAATFTSTDKTATCQVGALFTYQCGGMKFVTYESATQTIAVEKLAKAVYTFYVQFLPTDPKLQALNQKQTQVGLTQAEQNSIDNSAIWTDMAPVVTLYAQEQEGPIVQYQIPPAGKQQEKNQPNLTWLVLCVDGSIGDVTQSSPGQFWNYARLKYNTMLVNLSGTNVHHPVRQFSQPTQFVSNFIINLEHSVFNT